MNFGLTLFLQVTCTRYSVSGQRDNCASGVSVNRLPMRPPPDTSQVTKHWLGTFVDVHVMSADVKEPSRIIEWMFNLITSNRVVLIIDGCSEDSSETVEVQLFQHWKIKKKIDSVFLKMLRARGLSHFFRLFNPQSSQCHFVKLYFLTDA